MLCEGENTYDRRVGKMSLFMKCLFEWWLVKCKAQLRFLLAMVSQSSIHYLVYINLFLLPNNKLYSPNIEVEYWRPSLAEVKSAFNGKWFADVLMGIPKRDLLGMTVAVLKTAGYWFSAVWKGLIQRRYSNLNFRNWTHRPPAAGNKAVLKSCDMILI